MSETQLDQHTRDIWLAKDGATICRSEYRYYNEMAMQAMGLCDGSWKFYAKLAHDQHDRLVLAVHVLLLVRQGVNLNDAVDQAYDKWFHRPLAALTELTGIPTLDEHGEIITGSHRAASRVLDEIYF